MTWFNFLTFNFLIDSRERVILAYFKKHKIELIKLVNNKLVIKYQGKVEEEKVNSTELRLIKTYTESLGQSQLSFKRFRKVNYQESQPTNYLPYILGGVGK